MISIARIPVHQSDINEVILLDVMLLGEQLERGHISPTDAAKKLVEVPRSARDAARQTVGRP